LIQCLGQGGGSIVCVDFVLNVLNFQFDGVYLLVPGQGFDLTFVDLGFFVIASHRTAVLRWHVLVKVSQGLEFAQTVDLVLDRLVGLVDLGFELYQRLNALFQFCRQGFGILGTRVTLDNLVVLFDALLDLLDFVDQGTFLLERLK
jgi:hypothetical protein